MTTITLTVSRVDPPKPNGGKKSKIVGVAGETIYAFPDKAAKFTPGRTYEIDYSTNEWKGQTFQNLESFTEVEAKTPAAALPSQGGGAAFRTPEQMFVSDILTAYIAAGKIANPADLLARTQQIREVWHHTFGSGTFLASEAGKQKAA